MGAPKRKPAPDAGKPARAPVAKAAPAELLQPATGAMPRKSKFQAFQSVTMRRTDLKGAPYNPRGIDPHAKKKLRAFLKKKGLLAPVTWNRRTGNFVGGHQRLKCLDELEGTDQYSLDVAVVDMSEKDEIEANVGLNHHGIQGSWDLTKLDELFQGKTFKPEEAGLDPIDIEMLFPDGKHSRFALENQPEAVQKTVLELEELARIKREKKAHKERARAEADTEFHVMVTCRDRAMRERLMEALGQDPDTRYLDARVLFSHLGVEESA